MLAGTHHLSRLEIDEVPAPRSETNKMSHRWRR